MARGPIIPQEELVNLLRGIALLLADDISLLDSLAAVIEDARGPVRKVLKQIRADVEGGMALSQAMAQHAEFPRPLIAAVWGGERGGDMVDILLQHSNYLERTAGRAARLRVITLNIRIILLTAAAAVFILLITAWPAMFKLLDALAPAAGPQLFSAVPLISGAALTLALAIAGWLHWLSRGDRVCLTGRSETNANRLEFGATVADSLSVLLRASVPLDQSLKLIAAGVEQRRVREWLTAAAFRLEHGEKLSVVVADSPFLAPGLAGVALAGERSEDLPGALERAAELYAEFSEIYHERHLQTVSLLLLICAGFVTGLTALLLFVPYFRLISAALEALL